MSLSRLCVASLVLGTFTAASAQEFFDFGEVPGLPDQPAVQLDLDASMLGFVTATAQITEPMAADLLSNIDGVRVRIYKELEDTSAIAAYLNDTSNRLTSDNWQQLVRIQEGGDVRIYVQADESVIRGVTAMIVNNRQAVFVNIAGSITPEQLAEVMAMAGATNMFPGLSLADPANPQETDGAN